MANAWKMEGKELLRFGKAIEDFGEKQFPIINGMALNRTAFETRKEYVKNVEKKFTLRNKGTVRSIQFVKAKGFNPKTQESVVGSTMPYMAEQEFGGVRTSKGKKGYSLPTTTASNESRGARPRQKQVTRSRRRSSIRLTKVSVKSHNRKQHIVNTIRAVSARGSGKFVYLPISGKGKGIYRITGKGKRAKIDMIYALNAKSVPIKKQPTLTPAVNTIIPQMPGFYKEAAEKRMKKTFKF